MSADCWRFTVVALADGCNIFATSVKSLMLFESVNGCGDLFAVMWEALGTAAGSDGLVDVLGKERM